MKKAILIFSILLAFCLIFVSCNNKNTDTNIDTDLGSNTDTDSSSNIDTDSSNNTDTDSGSNTDTNSGSNIDTDSAIELAPNFTVVDKDGKEVSLRDFIGEPVVINFWASWCPPCKAEMPDFEEAYRAYGDRVHFLMIDVMWNETVNSANSFIASQGYTFPIYFDVYEQGGNAYYVDSIPRTIFIDEKGEMQAYERGMISKEALYSAINALLNQASE